MNVSVNMNVEMDMNMNVVNMDIIAFLYKRPDIPG